MGNDDDRAGLVALVDEILLGGGEGGEKGGGEEEAGRCGEESVGEVVLNRDVVRCLTIYLSSTSSWDCTIVRYDIF